jgi:hypothetical protein
MSLQIKKICSFKVKGTPFSDNIFNNISSWKKNINEELTCDNINPIFFKNNPSIEINDSDLSIICIQGLYGYRTGLVGKLFNIGSRYLSKISNPRFLQSVINNFYSIESNDYEIVSFGISLLSRLIPINNIFVYDSKSELSNNYSNNLNDSHPSIFDFSSLFLLKPLFDSGCAIYSNKEYTNCGFEKWNCTFNNETYKNKGMVWCYYESADKKNGITVINLDFHNNNNDLADIEDINQLINLKNKLESQFYTEEILRYETYIVGNFNILFNMSNIIKEIEDKLSLLQNANINIISDTESAACEKFILYSKIEKEESVNEIKVIFPEEPYIKLNDDNTNIPSTTEELVIKDNIEIEYKENYFGVDNNINDSINSESSEDWEHVI